jgi:Family of unknown function (DUF6502)
MATKKKFPVVPLTESYQAKVIFSLLEFLQRSGLNAKDILELVESELKRLPHRHVNSQNLRTRKGSRVTYVVGLALYRWHRDPEFIDANGDPVPLALSGRAPSVESLIRHEKPEVSVKDLVSEFKSLKLIRPAGNRLYLPTNIAGRIRTDHPILLEHLANSVVRLLSTARENTKSKSDKTFIERFVHVPDLKVSKVSEFRDFSNQQAAAFLATIDDWLESNRVARRPTKEQRSVPAGVHAFAFLGDQNK